MSKSNELIVRLGLASQLESAFDRNRWRLDEVNDLTKGKFLLGVRDLLNGEATLKYREYLLDDENPPAFPERDGSFESWKYVHYERFGSCKLNQSGNGDLYVNGRKVMIFNGSYTTLLKEGYVPLNLRHQQFLLNNPKLIPFEWEDSGECICFSGTIRSAYATYMHREENWKTEYILSGLRFGFGKWAEDVFRTGSLTNIQNRMYAHAVITL